MSRKTILILGDSNCVPRIEDNILDKDIFPYMLAKNYNVINRAKRGNNTSIQTEELNIADDIKCFNVDYCLINLGFVDYVPRLFTRKEQKILSLLPKIINKPIIKFFSKNRLKITKLRKITYVDIESFEKNYQKIIDSVESTKNIILIKIINPSEKLKEKSYGIDINIKLYNDAIERLALKNNFNIIDPNLFICDNIFLDDGIHFRKEIHNYLYEKISEVIK